MTVDCYNCKRPVNVASSGCRACGSAVVRPRGMLVQSGGPVNVIVEHNYAGLFARGLAQTVDSLIIGAILIAVYAQFGLFSKLEAYVDGSMVTQDTAAFASGPVDFAAGPSAFAPVLDQAFTTMILAGAVVSLLYYTVLLSIAGRTLAGFFFRIKVVDAFSGGRVSPLAALVRAAVANWNSLLLAAGVIGGMPTLVMVSGYTGLLQALGYTMAFWDSQRQTLHDKLAGTVVVSG
jgi:uncharacterized RDD family membrane protein YckC